MVQNRPRKIEMKKVSKIAAQLFICGMIFSGLNSCSNKDDLGDDAKDYFIKYYGNTGSDEGFDLAQTSDGGYALFGSKTYGITGSDLVLIKTDEFGNLQWEQSYGGPLDDVGRKFQIKSDGSYVMIGTYRNNNDLSDPTGNSLDAYVVWADVQGNKTFDLKIDFKGDNPGIFKTNDEGYGLAIDEFGGSDEVFVVGYCTAKRASVIQGFDTVSNEIGKKDILYARVSPTSGILWENVFGFENDDVGFDAIQVPAGNSTEGDYLITGYNEFVSGTFDVFLGIFLRNGSDNFSILGTRLTNGISEPISEGRELVYVDETEMYIGGWTGNASTSSILLISGSQNDFFTKAQTVTFFGETGFNRGFGMDYVGDGSVIISGSTDVKTFGGSGFDHYLLQVNNLGTLDWEMRYGGTGDESASSVIRTKDGGYAFIGVSDFESNALINFIKTDSKGIVGN
jgi:hypothetical protein